MTKSFSTSVTPTSDARMLISPYPSTILAIKIKIIKKIVSLVKMVFNLYFVLSEVVGHLFFFFGDLPSSLFGELLSL